MAHDAVHDLTPAYALDALDELEREEYEAHLASCEDCRAELASLQESASSLAYAVPAPAPPPALRERVLERARSERANVIPLRSRRMNYALGAVAAVAATAAIVFGLWNLALLDERDELYTAVDPTARVLVLPEDAPMTGQLVIDRETGEATLVVDSRPVPPEKDYEIWVIQGNTPRPAGLFDGDRERDIVRLSRPVPRGASVAVTIERKGGVDRPTTRPLFVVRT
jgi:anti-sigma-K factor RskA